MLSDGGTGMFDLSCHTSQCSIQRGVWSGRPYVVFIVAPSTYLVDTLSNALAHFALYCLDQRDHQELDHCPQNQRPDL